MRMPIKDSVTAFVGTNSSLTGFTDNRPVLIYWSAYYTISQVLFHLCISGQRYQMYLGSTWIAISNDLNVSRSKVLRVRIIKIILNYNYKC